MARRLLRLYAADAAAIDGVAAVRCHTTQDEVEIETILWSDDNDLLRRIAELEDRFSECHNQGLPAFRTRALTTSEVGEDLREEGRWQVLYERPFGDITELIASSPELAADIEAAEREAREGKFLSWQDVFGE
jgi:hypothetical protein